MDSAQLGGITGSNAPGQEGRDDAIELAYSEIDASVEAIATETDLEDSLLECLEYLARYHNRPKSKEVLRAGLPLAGPHITPSIFVRAAERAGFRSRVVKRSIKSISPDVLPAVLTLRGGKACVLLEFKDRDTVRLMLPETGGGFVDTKLSDLKSTYTGYAIYVRPEFLANEDTGLRRKSGQSWFWGTIAQNWWTYFQVGIAALMINLFGLASPLFIMNVYDRVIPNSAMDTLFVLAFGMTTVIGTELIIKTLRAYFIDAAGKHSLALGGLPGVPGAELECVVTVRA